MCNEKLPKSTIHNWAFSKNVPALVRANPQSPCGLSSKPFIKLGKLIEVRKKREKDEKAKTPAKQKPGGKKGVFIINRDLEMTSDIFESL